MARIFDNADEKFEEGLHAILTNAGVERADFCTGYFNLRGWKKVAADVEDLPGGEVFEMDGKGGESSVRRICRLLVGMHAADFRIRDMDKLASLFARRLPWAKPEVV